MCTRHHHAGFRVCSISVYALDVGNRFADGVASEMVSLYFEISDTGNIKIVLYIHLLYLGQATTNLA